VVHVVDPAAYLGDPSGMVTLPEPRPGEHWLAFELRITNDAGQPLLLLAGGLHDSVLGLRVTGGLDPASIDSGMEPVDLSDCPGLGVAAEHQLPVGTTVTGCLGVRLAPTSTSITLEASVSGAFGRASDPPAQWFVHGP
jgi:hypothetical protein